MKIISIEPTPSPNSMKINVDEKLRGNTRYVYSSKNQDEAPAVLNRVLNIDGVKEIYHAADFLALERNPRFDWKQILPQVRAAFGETSIEETAGTEQEETAEAFGEVRVLIHKFRGIPMQVKLTDGVEEKRFGLPEKFLNGVMSVAKSKENIIVERKWEEQGARYGSLDEIGEQVVEEVLATYDDQRLNDLLDQANSENPLTEVKKEKNKISIEVLDDPDWKSRYAALDKLDPEIEDLPILEKALKDEKASIRRLVVVYLGMLETKDVLPLLYKAVLDDSSVTVRRTAGDTLSDIGDPAAIPTMIRSLKDKNKLVRWRAAMFLYEVGDESAIDALKEAQYDSEFEVAMQIKMALKRIEGGEEAEGSVWKQMTESINKK